MLSYRLILALLVCIASHCDLLAQPIRFQHEVIDQACPADPWGKSFGDLNGDGKPDLILGGSKSGGLVWYQNPSWNKHVISATDNWSTDHEAIDVDSDGDLDVVALTKQSVCWLENPSWKRHDIERRVLHDIEAADFDGDGDIDLVGRDQGEFGHSGATLHFYRQDAASVWTHVSLPCLDGEGLAVADMDQDGDMDVVINAVWFENSGQLEPNTWPVRRYGERWIHAATFVAPIDLNQDGRMDVLLSPSELAGKHYRISWFEAPPDPRTENWTEHVIAVDVEAVHHFVGGADFDLDGDIDVVTAEMVQGADPDEVRLYRNAGDNTQWSVEVIATTGSHSMRVLDIDGDGDSDLFGANWQGTRADVWINQTRRSTAAATQTWTYIQLDAAREERAFGIATGDVDGDGDQDIASGAYLYRNPGGDMTQPWTRMDLPSHVDANFIVDVDGDERADILAQKLPDLIWLEATAADDVAFETHAIASGLATTGHGSSQGFALGDLTGNGRPEYVLTTGAGISFVTIPDQPKTQPWPRVHVTSDAPEEGVAVGDFDGDGALDIVAWFGSGSGSNVLGWWRNPRLDAGTQANWVYREIGMVEGAEGDRIAVGDFNGDGHIDVAATGTTNQAVGSFVYWFQNPGQLAGGWLREGVAANVGAMNSMSVADIDGDDSPDIITGEHRGEKKVVVWRNRQQGRQWLPQVVDVGKESHLGAQVADLDGDGDLDILSIGWDDFATFHVWRNDR